MKWLKRILYLALFSLLLLVVIYFVTSGMQETKTLTEETRQSAPGTFIRLSDGVTHYLSLGSENDTPLLFIHGGGITGLEVWRGNANFFVQQGYRVVLYDLYGRGYSDRPDGEYTPELLLNQLNELITTLNLPDTLSIISMSLGSMVALDFATQNPDKVKSLVMIDPAITGDYRPNPLLKFPVVSDLLMTLYWYPRAVENQRKEFVDAAVFTPYAKRLEYFMNFDGYKHMNYSTWMHTLNQNKSELLANLNTNSVLLMYGEKDPYFSATHAAKLKSLLSRIEIIAVADAGHMPHFEKPAIVNALLLEFWGRTNTPPTTEMPE